MKFLKCFFCLTLILLAFLYPANLSAADPWSAASPGRDLKFRAEHFFPQKQQETRLDLKTENIKSESLTAPSPTGYAPATQTGVTIYGMAKCNGTYSIVSFDMNNSATLTSKKNMDQFSKYEMGVYAFGRFYTLYNLMDRAFTLSSFDVRTWNRNDIANLKTNPMSVSTTFNPSDGAVYGCFINSTTSDYEFATLSMSNGAKTSIAALTRRFVAMAADNSGNIFAIGADGVLYNIDPKTGTPSRIGSTGVEAGADMQCACYDTDNESLYWFRGNTVYVVDTNTGTATAVTEITGTTVNEWIGTFTLPENTASMPGWPNDFNLQFEDDSLTGIISFEMPTKDTMGNPITDILDYTVKACEATVLSGKAAPGEKVSETVTIAEGEHIFKVYATNNGTQGMEIKTTRFIGHDTPNTPSGLEIQQLDNNDILISWNAVVTSVHGGYINRDRVSYDIVRQPGDVALARNLKQPSFTDNTINSLGFYSYEISATDGTKTSDLRISDRMLLGSAIGITPPYKYLFDEPNGFGLFTQVDANNDGYTWMLSDNPHMIWIPTNPNAKSDDWLISPPMNLTKGLNYNLQIVFEGSMRMESHMIEVYYGTSPDPATMTHKVGFSKIFKLLSTYNDWIKTEIDGPVYIGIHVLSPAVEGALRINSFSIGEGYASDAPAAVSGLNAVAAPKGGMSATISFTAPNTDFSGASLEKISRIVVSNTTTGKDYEITSVQPGKSVSLTDSNPAEGTNTYKVICFNDGGKSLPTEVSLWVGMDIPGKPSNVRWTFIDDTKVRLTWDAPTGGEHGGYVNLDDIRYYVVVPDYDQVISTSYEARTMDIEIPHDDVQMLLSFGVCGVNEKGLGVAVRSNSSAYGKPITAPLYESFENAGMHSTPWVVKNDEGYNSCNAITDIYGVPIYPYDDNGMVAFTMFAKGSTRLELPLLDISKLANPALKMWIFFVGGDARVKVRGNIDAGANWVDLGEIKSDLGEKGWHLVTVPLNRFSGERRVQFGIEMIVDETPEYYYYVLLDKLSIVDNPQRDVMISAMTVPDRANAGETFPITVDVTNAGWRKVDSFTVDCTVNGLPVLSEVCDALEPDEVTTVALDVPLSSNATSLELIVEATCEGDANPLNGAWKATHTQVVRSRYPQPTALSNTSSDEQTIKLEWTAPENRYQATVTDDMESYEHGSVGGIDVRLNNATNEIEANVTEGRIGNYRLVDNDKMLTTSVILLVNQLPHEREGMVCQVIDLGKLPGVTATSSIWSAHSGTTLLCFWQSRTAADNYDLPNDDWLILPELAENDPHISLWAKSLTPTYGLEQFEVMVSMDSNRLEDFTAYESVTNIPAGYANGPNAGYTFYEFELPEGTRYAAIRYNAAGSTALLVDDITYTPTDNYSDLKLLGYNVYRNGVKINKELLTSPVFEDAPTADGDYLYNVTSVFAEGESRYSNTVRVMNYKSEIDGVDTVDSRIYVDNREIIAVGFAGQQIDLYTTDGKLLRSVKGSEITRIAVNPGMYLLRTAGQAVTVSVK